MSRKKVERVPVVTAKRTKAGWRVAGRSSGKTQPEGRDVTEVEMAVEAMLDLLDEAEDTKTKE